MSKPRHKWCPDYIRFQFHTERHCTNPGCNLIRVTMHPSAHEKAWWEWQWGQDGERFKTDGNLTPTCKMSDGVATI